MASTMASSDVSIALFVPSRGTIKRDRIGTMIAVESVEGVLREVQGRLKGNGITATVERVELNKLGSFQSTTVLEKFLFSDIVVTELTLESVRENTFYHLLLRQRLGYFQSIVLYKEDAASSLKFQTRLSAFSSFKYTEHANAVLDAWKGTGLSDELYPEVSKFVSQLPRWSERRSLHAKVLSLGHGSCDTATALKQMAGLRDSIALRQDIPQVEAVYCHLCLQYRHLKAYEYLKGLASQILEHFSHNDGAVVLVSEQYAFALRQTGDEEAAMKLLAKTLSDFSRVSLDSLSALADMYKARYIDHRHPDDLELAEKYYEEGFRRGMSGTWRLGHPAVNLALLKHHRGATFDDPDLQELIPHLAHLVLNQTPKEIKEFWDLSTAMLVAVLARDFQFATGAAKEIQKRGIIDWKVKMAFLSANLIFPPASGIEDDMKVFDFFCKFFMKVDRDYDKYKFYVLDELNGNDLRATLSIDVSDAAGKPVSVSRIDTSERIDFGPDDIESIHSSDRSRLVFLKLENAQEECKFFFGSDTIRIQFLDAMRQVVGRLDIADMTKTLQRKSSRLDVIKPVVTRWKIAKRQRTPGGIEEFEVLGKGSFGTVYAGMNVENGQLIAIKEILLPHISDDGTSHVDEAAEKAVKEIQGEIGLLSSLKHENIVQYYGCDVQEDRLYVLMEHVSGGSLSNLLEKWGPLEESVIRNYAVQVLRGLEYLHANNIIHRDIKGGNILVTHGGDIKIADFGCAKRMANLGEKAYIVKGTLTFMAPEVMRHGGRGYGKEADIWSFGCTVVQMASGSAPWSELTCEEAAVFKVRRAHVPPFPSTLSKEAVNFLNLCFKKKPEDRPSATELLQHPFIARKSLENHDHDAQGTTFDKKGGPVLQKGNILAAELESVAKSLTEDESSTDSPLSRAKGWSFKDAAREAHKRTYKKLSLFLGEHETSLIEGWRNRCLHEKQVTSRGGVVTTPSFFQRAFHTLYGYIRQGSTQQEDSDSFLNEVAIHDASRGIGVDEIQQTFYEWRKVVLLKMKNCGVDPHWSFELDDIISHAVNEVSLGVARRYFAYYYTAK